MEKSLESLAIDFKQGNDLVFTEIYDRMFKKIYRFIYFKTFHKETAEDITSQVFMKILDKMHSYKPEKGKFSSWVYRIAQNKVIDYYRTRKTATNIDDVWDLADSTDVAIDVENRQKLEEVYQYLKKLKPQQREIIVMRVWQELSYREIADILGKSEASCKVAFGRSIAKLRESIPLTAFLLLILMKHII